MMDTLGSHLSLFCEICPLPGCGFKARTATALQPHCNERRCLLPGTTTSRTACAEQAFLGVCARSSESIQAGRKCSENRAVRANGIAPPGCLPALAGTWRAVRPRRASVRRPPRTRQKIKTIFLVSSIRCDTTATKKRQRKYMDICMLGPERRQNTDRRAKSQFSRLHSPAVVDKQTLRRGAPGIHPSSNHLPPVYLRGRLCGHTGSQFYEQEDRYTYRRRRNVANPSVSART